MNALSQPIELDTYRYEKGEAGARERRRLLDGLSVGFAIYLTF